MNNFIVVTSSDSGKEMLIRVDLITTLHSGKLHYIKLGKDWWMNVKESATEIQDKIIEAGRLDPNTLAEYAMKRTTLEGLTYDLS